MKENKKNKTTQAEKNRERISIDSGSTNSILDINDEQHGDSINTHKNIESGNTFIAEKVMKQTFNNS